MQEAMTASEIPRNYIGDVEFMNLVPQLYSAMQAVRLLL